MTDQPDTPASQLRDQLAAAIREVMEQDLTYRAQCKALTAAVLAVPAIRGLQRMEALLGEAVDWIPEGEMRDRICDALNQPRPPAA